MKLKLIIRQVRLAIISFVSILLSQVCLAQKLPIKAKSALLADAETGEVLWQFNPNLKYYPASLTKIMTAVLILEIGKLEDWVEAPKEAAFTGESSMGLKEGERVKMKDLLEAILVRSANDACVAAAIHLSGSVEKFVNLMNEKAKDLGMTDSHFVNPHGLHDPNHFTTAKDLLILTRYALQNPTFRKIVTKREIIIQPTNKSALRHYRSRNKLLELYPGCDGVKTGYTIPAGKCLIASATRNGWQLIAIVLGSQDHFADCATLLDYGFNNFARLILADKGEEIALLRFPNSDPEWLKVVAAEPVKVIVPKSQINRIKSQLVQIKSSPPISKGEVVGEMVWDIPGASAHKINLVASHDLNWSRKARAIMMGERILLALVAIGIIQALLRRKKKGGRRL
ncbi:MAG: D-alanyl-D-alanine carboxypeptidase family protein [Armatimonadota bacterium]|nr:D-alanyl-D-alanine carboxypeptidase family protein [Armatimonadota bacterium]